MLSLCDGWEFTPAWSTAFLCGETEAEKVRLPHNVKELPLHYAAPEDYEMVCGYRRRLRLPAAMKGKRIFLQFDGAAHIAEVYVNGAKLAEHRCGYTAFRLEITEHVSLKEENDIAVKLDTREDPSVPPFGFVIDYLTYGGLYREAWLDARGSSVIEDLFVHTPELTRAEVSLRVNGPDTAVRLTVLDGEKVLASRQVTAENGTAAGSLCVPQALPWSPDSPQRYTLRAELLDAAGGVIDREETAFGFRTAEFRKDGLYLNGKRVFLRGLNRHQSYPYIGYAAPESLQREDARILKEELQCNAVRTSHYPQSRYFIDACDRLGLLVFTELPGWQHVGGEKWKQQALRNLSEMVLQYRNHPSIVLWGVRINESQDDDVFYARANGIAHALDPSRQTSGVRYLEKSSLLEDVYAYNDFSHNGLTPGVKPKKSVTPDLSRPLLISEHNGHMYPTKSYDPWFKRQEQALRHARVLNDANDGEHAGAFGWCMFDYPTHKDFGSGDRVCYHGVMDAFRNPKLAAALYASQGDDRPVLEVGSPMDIGDYAAGRMDAVYAFTNADEVRLYKNGVFVKSFVSVGWKGLKHGPVAIDDTIGNLVETQEKLPHAEAELLRECMLAAARDGLANLGPVDKLKLLRCMAQYGLTMEDGVALYGKYVSNWGGTATVWRFEAVKNGKVIAVREKCPGRKLHLEVKASAAELREDASYDMAAVRIRILDEQNNLASYAQLPVSLQVSGCAKLIGPAVVTAEGGMCGTYLRSSGRAGTAGLTVNAPGLEPAELKFKVSVDRAARLK